MNCAGRHFDSRGLTDNAQDCFLLQRMKWTTLPGGNTPRQNLYGCSENLQRTVQFISAAGLWVFPESENDKGHPTIIDECVQKCQSPSPTHTPNFIPSSSLKKKSFPAVNCFTVLIRYNLHFPPLFYMFGLILMRVRSLAHVCRRTFIGAVKGGDQGRSGEVGVARPTGPSWMSLSSPSVF